MAIKFICILALLLSIFNLTNQLDKCFYKYPKSLGDNLDDTDIRGLDMDSMGYIVTAGLSLSSNLKPSGLYAAMIGYYDPYSVLLWMYKLNNYNQKIKTMQMIKSTGRSPKALMTSQDQTDNRLIFYIFDLLNSGAILSLFKDTSGVTFMQFTGYQQNFYYDSTGYIYASLCTKNNNKFLFMKIDPQPTSVSTFSPIWSLTELTTSYSSAGIALIKGTQPNEFYYTTSFLTSLATISTMRIHRINVATPSLTASYSYQNTRASTITYSDFSGIDVVEPVAGIQTIVGGGYFQYQSTEYIALTFKMEIDLTTGTVNNNFVIQMSSMKQYQCMDSKYIDATQFYTLAIEMYLQYDFYLFRTYSVDYINNKATVSYQKITIGNSYWIYYGQILSNADALFAGSYIKSSIEQAFFQISDVDKSCSTLERTPINTTLTNQPFSATIILKDTTNYITPATIQFTSQTSVSLISITQAFITATLYQDLVFDCTNIHTFMPISISGTSTYTLPTVHVKQSGHFQLDMDTLFTGDQLCADKSRTYTITAIAGNTNTYSITSGQYLFASQSSLSAATDQIKISVDYVNGDASILTITITIVDCSISQITLPSALSSVSYTINGIAQTKNFNSYSKTKSYCQNPTISFSISPSITPSTAVQLDATTKVLTIYSTDNNSKGTYTVSAIYTNPYNTADIYTFPFTLTVICMATLTGTSTGLANNFTYYINSGTKIFDLNTLYSYSNNCGYSTSYAIQQTNGSSLPSFISISSSTMIVSVNSVSDSDKASYSFYIIATLNDAFSTSHSTFTWDLVVEASQSIGFFNLSKNAQAPYYSQTLPTLSVQCEEKLEYSLPEIKDDQSGQINVSFNLNYARLYTQVVDSKKLIISPSCDQKGVTSIMIYLTDSGQPPLSTTYKLVVNVYDSRPVNYTQEQVDKSFLNTITDEEYFNDLPQQQKQLFLDFNASIINIELNGDVSIKVNQDLTFNESKRLFEDCEIRVTFVSIYLDNAELMSYRILSYHERVINLNLQFKDPDQISINDLKDRVSILLSRHSLKRDLASSEFSRVRNTVLLKYDIPLQVSKNEESTIQSIAIAMRVFLYIMIFLSLFLIFSRKRYNYMIWNMFCILQLIIHLPLFDSNFPAVSLYFVKHIINPINLNMGAEIFKFFNLIPLLGRNFHNVEIDYFNRNYDIEPNEKFQAIGYDSIYGLVLLESFTILIAFGSIISLIDYLFLKFIKSSQQIQTFQPQNQYFANAFRSIVSEFTYNWLLRVCIQFYLQLCIIGYMILIMYSDLQFNQRLIINVIVAALLFIFIKILVFQTTYQLKTLKHKQKQSVQEFRKQYGSLFDDVDINCSNYEYYIMMFYLRKIVYGLFIPSCPIQFQVCFQLIFSSIALVYLIKYKPMKGQYQNEQCLFNESILVLCLYLTLMLSDVQNTRKFQYHLGWLYNSLIILCILVNFTAITGSMIKDFIQKIKTAKVQEDQTSMTQTQARLFDSNVQNLDTEQKEEILEDISFSEYSLKKKLSKSQMTQWRQNEDDEEDRTKTTSTVLTRNYYSGSVSSRVGQFARQFTRRFLTPKTVDHLSNQLKTVKIKGVTDRPAIKIETAKDRLQKKNIYGYPIKFDPDTNINSKNRFQVK